MAQQALLETNANGVAIALKEEGEFVCRATAGEMAPTIGVRLQKDSGITAACIRSAQAVVCRDTGADERVNAAACKDLGIASLVVIPIKNRASVVGFMEAFSEKTDAFGAGEQAALERIAHEIDEVWLGETGLVGDETTEPLDFGAPSIANEHEQETPAGAPGSFGESPSYAEQGSEVLQYRSKLAVVVAPLAVMCVIGAALFLIFGRAGAHEPVANKMLPSQFSTVPVKRAPLFYLAPADSAPAGRHSATESRTKLRPAALINSGNSIQVLQESAQAGDATAQVELANALASGAGVTADPVSAEAWYIVANLAGDAKAADGMRSLSQRLSNSKIAAVRLQLATMYWKGTGVKRDLTTAYFWLTVAEAAGAQGVDATRQRLAQEMRTSQIAEANLRAQQWLVQHHQLIAQDLSH